jgi:DNA mismatch repair ATPase MutS
MNKLASDISRIQPKEIILPERSKILLTKNSDLANFFNGKSFTVSWLPDADFVGSCSRFMELLLINDPKKLLKAQISYDFMKSFSKSQVAAGSALLTYISHIFPSNVKPIFRIPELNQENQMILDANSLRALEIIKTSREQSKKVKSNDFLIIGELIIYDR